MSGQIGLIRSVSWSHHALAQVCLFSPKCIIQSALVKKCLTLYLMSARRWRLRVTCIKRKGLFGPVRLLSYKNQNLTEAQNLALSMSTLIMYPHLNQGKWVSLLVQVGLCSRWWSIGEKQIIHMAFSNKKKFKWNPSELDSSLANEAESPFPSFIVIESTSLPITNLSLFIIEKVIPSNLTLIPVKKN